MPAPLSYSESDLAAFMVDELADVAVALGWTATTPRLVRAVYATERACGVPDISSVTDPAMVEAVGAREAWRAAMGAAAARVNKRVGDLSKSESDLFAQCRANYLTASTEAMAYDTTNVIGVASVTYAPDVYGPLDTSGEFG
jgi:hypothetical protein